MGGSISVIPKGLNGASGFENSQAPSGLRVAIRMLAPGICSDTDQSRVNKKERENARK